MIVRKVLERHYVGIYRFTADPPRERTDLMATMLRAGRGAVATSRTAATVWDLPVDPPERPQILIPRSRRGLSITGVELRTTTRADREDATVHNGIPVTSPCRTLIDVAREVDDAVLSRAIASALRTGLVTAARLRHRCESLNFLSARGRGRVERLLNALENSSRPTESALEETFARLIDHSRLPSPTYQYSVLTNDGWLRLDAAYPDMRLGIEIDGFAWHSSPDQLDRDRHRSNTLAAIGWTILHFTSHDVQDRPDDVVAEIEKLYYALRTCREAPVSRINPSFVPNGAA